MEEPEDDVTNAAYSQEPVQRAPLPEPPREGSARTSAPIEAPAAFRMALSALVQGAVANAIVIVLGGVALIGANHAFEAIIGPLDASPLALSVAAIPHRFSIAACVFIASAAIALDTHARRPHRARTIIARVLTGFVTGVRYQLIAR